MQNGNNVQKQAGITTKDQRLNLEQKKLLPSLIILFQRWTPVLNKPPSQYNKAETLYFFQTYSCEDGFETIQKSQGYMHNQHEANDRPLI